MSTDTGESLGANPLDHLDAVVVGLDQEGRISYINDAALQLLGWSRAEIAGQSWFGCAVPLERRAEMAEVFRLIMEGRVKALAWYRNDVLTKSGGRVLLSWFNQLTRDERGGISGTLSIGRVQAAGLEGLEGLEGLGGADAKADGEAHPGAQVGTAEEDTDALHVAVRLRTSELVRVNEALSSLVERQRVTEASLDLYRRLFQRVSVGLVVFRLVDPSDFGSFELVDANPAAERLMGLSRTRFLGRPMREWGAGTVSSDRPRIYAEVLQSGIPKALGERYVPAGSLVGLEEGKWLSSHCFKLGAELVALSFEDVTARRRAEDHVIQQASELLRSNGELEQFAYVASHDLQEPLRKVQAFSDRLLALYEGSLDERGRDYLRRIQRSAARMQGLVLDLLTLSRVQTRRQSVEKVDLNLLLSEISAELIPLSDEPRGTITVGPLPSIEGDRTQLVQLFQNLLSNGLKFCKEGWLPRVRVGAGRLPGARWEFSVADEGVGFEGRHLDRILQPFQRLHPQVSYPGTGIGLAIVHRVVQRHHGTIRVVSAPGEGATFFITLPDRQPQPGEPELP
jgi:PAS domain S-box-containing protein